MRTNVWILISIFNVCICFAQEGMDLRLGDQSPSFYLRSLEGENFFLSDEIKADSPIIIVFYATWCVPCRIEIPALEKMMVDPALISVRLYYVNVGGLMATNESGDQVKHREEIEKVRKHKAMFNMTHPILLDKYAITYQKYGGSALPISFVIGGNGEIKYIHQGFKVGDEEDLRNLLINL